MKKYVNLLDGAILPALSSLARHGEGSGLGLAIVKSYT